MSAPAWSPRQEAPTLTWRSLCFLHAPLLGSGGGSMRCVQGPNAERDGRDQGPQPARSRSGVLVLGGAGACPGSAAPPGRGAAGRQTVLVVPSPLPSEVTPSLSHSPPSLRGKPPLGGQSTYRSPTLGPPALLLKLLARGTHQNHSTQTSGPPSLSQACQGRSLSHWGALCLVHCVCPKRLPLTGLGSGRCPWW